MATPARSEGRGDQAAQVRRNVKGETAEGEDRQRGTGEWKPSRSDYAPQTLDSACPTHIPQALSLRAQCLVCARARTAPPAASAARHAGGVEAPHVQRGREFAPRTTEYMHGANASNVDARAHVAVLEHGLAPVADCTDASFRFRDRDARREHGGHGARLGWMPPLHVYSMCARPVASRGTPRRSAVEQRARGVYARAGARGACTGSSSAHSRGASTGTHALVLMSAHPRDDFAAGARADAWTGPQARRSSSRGQSASPDPPAARVRVRESAAHSAWTSRTSPSWNKHTNLLSEAREVPLKSLRLASAAQGGGAGINKPVLLSECERRAAIWELAAHLTRVPGLK
ncbi:hypothetical protein FB451DRAFT_1163770 [Mycena latifolia]|nr:hypothetical protein FB451DRAFT_1163770 [Mycena latifolia]